MVVQIEIRFKISQSLAIVVQKKLSKTSNSRAIEKSFQNLSKSRTNGAKKKVVLKLSKSSNSSAIEKIRYKICQSQELVVQIESHL